MKRNYAISCDWLQVYCENRNEAGLCLNVLSNAAYTFVLQQCSSRQFKSIYKVFDRNDDHYADIQADPFSSIICQNGCIIRLSNRELYKCDFALNFIAFLNTYNFHFKSISRLDVCYDFNVFCQGMKPRRLINSFLNKRVLKNNQGNYQLMGSTHLINDYDYIRFGTRTSAVCTYMYNKSKELKEVKDKPYIRELWALNDLDLNSEVWRVEISIKADAKYQVCLSTGEVFALSPSSVITARAIEDVFYSYATKYFAFKINDGTKNKTRMKDVPLFSRIDEITRRPVRLTLASDSGRSDKIFVRKLQKIKTELRSVSPELLKSIEEVRRSFCIQKSLSSFYYQKVYDSHDEPK